MEIVSNLLQYFTSSETIILGIIILIFFVYKKFIEPKLAKLARIEKDENNKIKNLMTLDDFIKHRDEVHNELTETLFDKFEELQSRNVETVRDYFQDSVQLNKEFTKEIVEELMAETKIKLDNYMEVIEKVFIQLQEHDDKTNNYDKAIIDLMKMINLVYEILDNGFEKLEKKGVIDEFSRAKYKDINSEINHAELNKFIGLMTQVLEKQKPSNSRLNKILDIGAMK